MCIHFLKCMKCKDFGGIPFSHLCHLISCNVKKNLTDSDLLFPEKAESLPQDQKKKYAEKVCDERESDK